MQALLPWFEIQILPDLQVYCVIFPLSPGLSFWSWEPEVLNSIVYALLENKLNGLKAYHILEGGELLPRILPKECAFAISNLPEGMLLN